jgi:hypothetical protein
MGHQQVFDLDYASQRSRERFAERDMLRVNRAQSENNRCEDNLREALEIIELAERYGTLKERIWILVLAATMSRAKDDLERARLGQEPTHL